MYLPTIPIGIPTYITHSVPKIKIFYVKSQEGYLIEQSLNFMNDMKTLQKQEQLGNNKITYQQG